MTSTVLKLEEKFHLKKSHYKQLSLVWVLAFCNRTDTQTNVMVEKNAGTCLLSLVPEHCMLVCHGKFQCLMQSGFFSQPFHGTELSNYMKAC